VATQECESACTVIMGEDLSVRRSCPSVPLCSWCSWCCWSVHVSSSGSWLSGWPPCLLVSLRAEKTHVRQREGGRERGRDSPSPP
jgi:hypothetical protein